MNMRILLSSRALLLSALFTPLVLSQELEQQALTLAIERNAEVRRFVDACERSVFSTDRLKASVIVVPINKEILDVAIAYKTKIERLSDNETLQLRMQNYDTYILGNTAAFVLFVVINKDYGEMEANDEAYFRDFAKNTYLHDEKQKYKLERYTRVFDAKLSPGWNKGYLYFQNFRAKQNFSYSIHFSGLQLNACTDRASRKVAAPTWAMSFDESEMKFLSMLERGLSEASIREKFGITSYTTAGFTASDILNIISTVVSIITFIK